MSRFWSGVGPSRIGFFSTTIHDRKITLRLFTSGLMKTRYQNLSMETVLISITITLSAAYKTLSSK